MRLTQGLFGDWEPHKGRAQKQRDRANPLTLCCFFITRIPHAQQILAFWARIVSCLSYVFFQNLSKMSPHDSISKRSRSAGVVIQPLSESIFDRIPSCSIGDDDNFRSAEDLAVEA